MKSLIRLVVVMAMGIGMILGSVTAASARDLSDIIGDNGHPCGPGTPHRIAVGPVTICYGP